MSFLDEVKNAAGESSFALAEKQRKEAERIKTELYMKTINELKALLLGKVKSKNIRETRDSNNIVHRSVAVALTQSNEFKLLFPEYYRSFTGEWNFNKVRGIVKSDEADLRKWNKYRDNFNFLTKLAEQEGIQLNAKFNSAIVIIE